MRVLNAIHCVNGNGQRILINAKTIKSLYVEDIMQRRVFDDESGEVCDFQMAKFIAFEFTPDKDRSPIKFLEQNKISSIELRFSDGVVDTYCAYWGTPSLDESAYKHNRNQHVEVMKNGNIRVYISERRRNDSYWRSSKGNEVSKTGEQKPEDRK